MEFGAAMMNLIEWISQSSQHLLSNSKRFQSAGIINCVVLKENSLKSNQVSLLELPLTLDMPEGVNYQSQLNSALGQ